MFSRILIANRGEIACRIMRTARRLGISTVAVYSDADDNALHVQHADSALRLGPAPSQDSYLCVDKIIAAAKASGVQAIHPGYGFLSENAAFAQACADNDLVFIGPSATAIRTMGSKSGAKTLMAAAGVPLIPGYHGDDQRDDVLFEKAREIGFPVLLKASAGGGGKGMRSVHHEQEFPEALAAARREALNSFGDAQMLIEKLLLQPRHVEVQILADREGHVIYVFDRDCSIQRRHQKVLEEAPAPGLSPALRHAMGDAAVRAAKAIAYEGAGTLEFLVDAHENFYFMEMNTRLQVEHPVTEMISGLDLVEWQLRIAAGHSLPFAQAELPCRGHAIEVRLYAEDVNHGFLPSTGRLSHFKLPSGDFLRSDTGYQTGDEISVYYDPMMAKMIAWGENREDAARRLHAALLRTEIAGVRHNAGFLASLLTHPEFKAAHLSTDFIERHQADWQTNHNEQRLDMCLMAALIKLQTPAMPSSTASAPWQQLSFFRLGAADTIPLRMDINGQSCRLTLMPQADGFHYQCGERQGRASLLQQAEYVVLQRDSHRVIGQVHSTPLSSDVFCGGHHAVVHFVSAPTATRDNTEKHYNAPMNGRIVAINTHDHAKVNAGDTLLIMEAMKMEYRIRAHCDGEILAFKVSAGDLVQEGQSLLDFAAADEALA